MKKIRLFLMLAAGLMFSLGIVMGNNGEDKANISNNETGIKSSQPSKDIVDLAAETDILSTLVAAVKAGDLVDVLKGDGPFTVFAPTNDAFAALPEGTLENLLKPENKDQLVAILTYHVVSGVVMSSDLSDGMMAETVNGAKISISLKDGMAKVNGAKVLSADIKASNGVVHVIDKVILPPSTN